MGTGGRLRAYKRAMATALPQRPDPTCDHDALIAGDAGAWARLLAAEGPRIYALCRRLDPDPDDAFQAIWERVHQRMDRFDPAGPASLGTWIGSLARHLLVDRHRRRRVRGEVVGQIRLAEPGRADRVEEALDAEGRRQRLEGALSRLPPGQRRAVLLHHLDGLAIDTIAQVEGVAEGTIKSRLHRARARLVRLLGGFDP